MVLGLLLTGACGLFSDSKSKLSCVKERKILFCLGSLEGAPDLLSVPLVCVATVEKIPLLEFGFEGVTWNMTALYAKSIGEFMVDLPLKYKNGPLPLIAFVQDAAGDEYLMTIDRKGECALSSLPSLLKQSILVSKKVGAQNYLGYALDKNAKILCYFQQS
jgi:hypothetical protein